MTSSDTHNDRIPTDPTTITLALIIAVWLATHLTTDQAQALVEIGGFAQFLIAWIPRGGGR